MLATTDPAAGDDAADAVVLAHRGLGRLLHERGDLVAADDMYRRGYALADQHCRARHRALLEMSWATTLQATGQVHEALAHLERAEAALAGDDLGLVVMQRGVVLWFAGDLPGARAAYDRALPLIEAAADHPALTRLLGNRGVVAAQLGALRAARADVQRQLELATVHGEVQVAATALHNLGWLEGRLGNVPAALERFAAARSAYAALDPVERVGAALDTDECEVLLQANLAVEADDLAARVVEAADTSGNVTQLAEAMLMRARASLAMRRPAIAHQQATEAADLLRRTERATWAALADYVAEQAALELPDRDAATGSSRLGSIAHALSAAGWVAEAAEVRVHAGRRALREGLIDTARTHLELAARARRSGPAAIRAEAWHATALLRLAAGERAGARRAIEAGLRALDHHRATLGAIELRAHAAAHGVELGRLGLRLAIEDGSASAVLVWAERWRAGSLALPVPRADAEPELDALRELHVSGSPDATPPAAHAASGASRLAAAERAVTAKARLAPGDPRSVVNRIDVAALRAAVGDGALVEYVELDGALRAVVVTSSRCRSVVLGPLARVVAAHDHLVFALRRLSMLPAEHPALRGAVSALATAAAELDELLVAPLRLRGDRVVVPTGALHGIAWSTFPSLQQREVTIAPSAAWWLGASAGQNDRASASSARSRALLVEGPDLDGSAAELRALGELLPDAIALGDGRSTAGAVLAALPTADVAHIAAHGAFRADNPLFSSLRLADGPLWVHDLIRLERVPRLVVLTACEAGRSGILAGDELLGTATVLLSLGVRTVVAPLLPVPDLATARFAIGFHRALARGATPAAARMLAAAGERATGDPTGLAVAGAFHCIGRREPTTS